MMHILQKILKTGILTEAAPDIDESLRLIKSELSAKMMHILGRALVIRHVDAGSCNGCELEIHMLGNPYYNLEALGIKFTASPRHADLLLVTGPVAKNMEVALKRAYDATPNPKLVVAVGDCGANGGIFGESYASCGQISNVIPVDVVVKGCPPTPLQLMQGILTAITPDLSDVKEAQEESAQGVNERKVDACCASGLGVKLELNRV